ncbi:CoA-binding protein, partial [Candidatus Woesebacteria bacterium]|nr:CoA-binding protein [Candidatus Woesebacteria bacterium]
QGITGKEGLRSLEWVTAYGTKVVAGVTPGKGGQEVDGIPVYNSVDEAVAAHPEINASSIYAPPRFVRAAALEAIAADVPLIHIIGEEVPVKDTVDILHAAQKKGVRIVGPASIGLISPGKSKIGSIGGDDNQQFAPGNVAIISKSGGMSSEIALLLKAHGYGQSTVIGIGGNQLIGTTYADVVDDLENDDDTAAVIIIGEIGGLYEELLAEKLATLPNHKPYIAFISGRFAETLPQGMSFGHAGAIVDKHIGTRIGKIEQLQAVGAHIAENPSAIVKILDEIGIPKE